MSVIDLSDMYAEMELGQVEAKSLDDELHAYMEAGQSGVVAQVDERGRAHVLMDFSLQLNREQFCFTYTRLGKSTLKNALGRNAGFEAESAYSTSFNENALSAVVGALGFPADHIRRHPNRSELIPALKAASQAGQGRFVVCDSSLELESLLDAPRVIGADQVIDPKTASPENAQALGKAASEGRPVYLAKGHQGGSRVVREAIVKQPPPAPPQRHRETSMALALEYAAMQAMERAGAAVAQTRLLPDGNGGHMLAVERFDRQDLTARPGNDGALEVPEREARAGRLFQTMDELRLTLGGTPVGYTPCEAYYQAATRVNRGEANPANTALATSLAFSKMIGNEDLHGKNLGYFTRARPNGGLRAEPAPAFDISPYMLQCRDAATVRDSGLQGKVLSELTGDDLAASDKTLAWLREHHPTLFNNAVDTAHAIREQMQQIVHKELVRDGMLTREQARAFDLYMNESLTPETHKPSANPFAGQRGQAQPGSRAPQTPEPGDA